MNNFDLESVRLCGESGGAACLADLLDDLRTTIAAIPSCAGVLPGGDFDPTIPKVEAIAAALTQILSRSADALKPEELQTLTNLEDVRYNVEYYYPPAALQEWAEQTVSFQSVRELAEKAAIRFGLERDLLQ